MKTIRHKFRSRIIAGCPFQMRKDAHDDLWLFDAGNDPELAAPRAGNRPQMETIGQQYKGIFAPDNRVAIYEKVLKFLEQTVGGK